MTVQLESVDVLGGSLSLQVAVAGSGDPLLFLHNAGGLQWEPFLDSLAEHYTVYAPYFPGSHSSDPQGIEQIDSLWDAVLAYDDLIDGLGIESIRLVGHSFGGMLACELAAQRARDIQKLALISPVGLWMDEAPYTCATFTAVPAEQLPQVLFYRQDAPAVKQYLTLPEDPGAAADAQIEMVWALACTCKVIWPIPDKGLSKRIHRVVAPTLIVWGDQDRLCPAVYAKEFARRLPQSEVFMLNDVGHCPTLEDPDRVTPKVMEFLA